LSVLHSLFVRLNESLLSPTVEHTRLGVWTLDGDPNHVHLLKYALKEPNFTDTTVLLCVSMAQPWNIMDQLSEWARLLQDHIDDLSLSADRMKTLQAQSK
jgi:hypothetical protein